MKKIIKSIVNFFHQGWGKYFRKKSTKKVPPPKQLRFVSISNDVLEVQRIPPDKGDSVVHLHCFDKDTIRELQAIHERLVREHFATEDATKK